MKLKGKVAVVTGASKGIGAAIAEQLAVEGAAVVVNYSSSKESADRVVANIASKGGKAIAVQADMSKHSKIKRLFAETKKAFGKLDILINNAGIYEFCPIEDVTTERFHKMFDLNVLGLLLAIQEAIKLFGKTGGSIVNISSIASTSRASNTSVYAGTKGAVDALTRALAKELGGRQIRINTINPGMVITEGILAAKMDQSEFRKQAEIETPLGRIGMPNDITPAAVFLASDESSWLTGESIFISGGYR